MFAFPRLVFEPTHYWLYTYVLSAPECIQDARKGPAIHIAMLSNMTAISCSPDLMSVSDSDQRLTHFKEGSPKSTIE